MYTKTLYRIEVMNYKIFLWTSLYYDSSQNIKICGGHIYIYIFPFLNPLEVNSVFNKFKYLFFNYVKHK